MAETIKEFHMPRYGEIPNVGLYLDQTVQYINQSIQILGCPAVTTSMISNYVKLVDYVKPVKKLYYADQIVHLLAITIMKNVLSLENIHKLFRMQKGVYTDRVAYDYFCSELENMLLYIFEAKNTVEDVGVTTSLAKDIVAQGGAILTELNSQTKNNGRFFIPRNRLMAGMRRISSSDSPEKESASRRSREETIPRSPCIA